MRVAFGCGTGGSVVVFVTFTLGSVRLPAVVRLVVEVFKTLGNGAAVVGKTGR